MKKSLYPQAYGPGTWRGLPEKLIRLYSTVLSKMADTESNKLEQSEPETPPPSTSASR